jgi:hypothetical protein
MEDEAQEVSRDQTTKSLHYQTKKLRCNAQGNRLTLEDLNKGLKCKVQLVMWQRNG